MSVIVIFGVIAWVVPAFILNALVVRWGATRLSLAFGNRPRPLDGVDFVLVSIVSLSCGPLGPVLGYFFTDWWCSGFEEKDGSADSSAMGRKPAEDRES